MVTSPGEEVAYVDAELDEAGPEPVAFGRGPVRAGNLAQVVAPVEQQSLLAQLDRFVGSASGQRP